ncbi:Hypothetical predicted protein [Paramuricea clavata]|uniref:Uncharacterized protein n=1 Tax=Paramuricea clavata TaxID=317549 RepID=A0A7D9HQK8_PARCT|nr:Hypothetical predicted protein [Paramuricea clavata]
MRRKSLMEDNDEHEEQRDIGDNEDNNNHSRDEQQNLERQYPRRERRKPNYYH